MAFQYSAFGLDITSEIKFDELIHTNFDHPGGVHIRLGKVPDNLNKAGLVQKVRNQSRPGEYLLHIEGVASYYASEGHEVVIQPHPGADMASVRLFFLSSVMAAILHQKKMIPLHASAVKYKGKIILFCGPSGVGKSTTAAHLHKRGYDLFTDDICVIRSGSHRSNEIYGYASYPMTRLWKDAIELLDDENFSTERRVRSEINKFANFFWDSFETTPRAISKVIVFSTDYSMHYKVRDHTAIEQVALLKSNVFRRGQMDGLGGKEELFLTLTDLVNKVTCAHVVRPVDKGEVVKFIDFIEDVICERATIKV